MNKGKITTPEGMALDQIQEDVSMTPLQRPELAFRLSDLAIEIQKNNAENVREETSSVQWIELHKISPGER